MSWPVVTLKDICKTQYGYTASASETEVCPKFLRITDIVSDQIDWDSVPYCEIDESEIGNYQLHKGDIVIARTGNTTGYAKLIRDDVNAIFASYLVRLKLDRSVADPAYVGRLIESDIYKTFVKSIKGGAAQGNANAKMLTLFRFKLPPLYTQHRIASILSPYDFLIENNRRRIQLLEQSARMLYREWFVYMRFPGHEHVRIIDGVPEGWEVKQLSELCHIARGASPRPINDYMGGNVPWFKIGDATASESPFVFETKEKVTEDGARMSRTLPLGSFILSNSATCGIPYFTGVEGCIHDGWLCFWDFKRINKLFLYCFLHFKQRELLTIVCDGSTQKNLNTNIVGGLRVLLPMQNELMNIFLETVNPVFDMLFTLSKENIAIRKARDLLLPRLMNGEITV